MFIKAYKIKPVLIPAAVILLALILFYAFSGVGEQLREVSASSKKLPVYCVENGGNKEISLTINCAWGAEDIPRILEILKETDIKCTFFVLGVWAEKNPDAVKMISEAGHEIGNHSYSHKLPSKSSETQIYSEIEQCNNAVQKITGRMPSLYRAPSGDYNNTALDCTENMKMTAIQWSVDSLDWMKDKSKADIINRVTGGVKSGSIILFHNDTNYTAEALPEIITHLKSEGYIFVTVSDLLLEGETYTDSRGVQMQKQKHA